MWPYLHTSAVQARRNFLASIQCAIESCAGMALVQLESTNAEHDTCPSVHSQLDGEGCLLKWYLHRRGLPSRQSEIYERPCLNIGDGGVLYLKYRRAWGPRTFAANCYLSAANVQKNKRYRQVQYFPLQSLTSICRDNGRRYVSSNPARASPILALSHGQNSMSGGVIIKH